MKSKRVKNLINSIFDKFVPQASLSSRKKVVYIGASILDVVCLVLILVNGAKPAQRIIAPLISPFMTSLNSVNPLSLKNKTTDETFAFAPGWSDNKLSKIDFNGLKYLSYFDLPINTDGSIKTDSRSYESFSSEATSTLFERAHYFDTKVLLTLTLVNNNSLINFLNNSAAWDTLANQSIDEVKQTGADGVTIDFELRGEVSEAYQQKYTKFISFLTNRLHQDLPGSTVAVAVPNNVSGQKAYLYNSEDLSKVADKILIMAYDLAVPETKNAKPMTPVFFGSDENSYWSKLADSLASFFSDSDEKKLVMERAWYGNGDKYPLYTPNSTPPFEEQKEPSHVFLDTDTVNRLAASVPAKGRVAARQNIPIIGKALEGEGILDSNVLAYALATIEHETDETFAPIDEIQGRLSSRRLGYEGGTNYFGRGFIQLTHLRNYKAIGERIGMGDALVKNPDLAATPEVAAKILAAFFKDNNIANLASQGYFVAARRPVNPDRNGYKIADLAYKYEYEME